MNKAESQEKVRLLNGIQTVLNAINAHTNNVNVCERGCNIFKVLLDNNCKNKIMSKVY